VSCGPQVPAGANPGVRLGTLLGLAARQGRDKVTFVLGDALRTFGAWAEQLLAESTGKDGKGLVPVVDEALGGVEVYGPDRLFVSLQLAEQPDSGLDKYLEALENAGHPVVRITLPTPLGLGAECFRWEVATAVAGAVMGVNPFDEPNVVESKQHTRELLDAWQQHGTFSADAPLLTEDALSLYGAANHVSGDTVQEGLRTFVEGVSVPDYLTLLVYFHPTPACHELLQTLRLALRNRFKVATTLGYGPRYLHATGQLHKGGPNTGVFLLMTADEDTDVPIPGAAYGFATLKQAQALGDFQALQAKNRRVLRLHVHRDLEKSLERVAAYVL
jgi:transaldolase/glucose-6-phosphate isomerase